MKINLGDDILTKLPNFKVIAYTMEVKNQTSLEVTQKLENLYQKYHDYCPLTDVVNIPKIKESRDGYKKLGKDPSHTRLACESLLRRVIKGEELYRLGDIIDLGNILSIETMRSVCVVDYDKIEGDVAIRIGTSNDIYYGIKRGLINVDCIPLYIDSIGAFGNPTSDTERTKVDNNTKKILVMIICFSNNDLEKDEELLKSIYQTYGKATSLQKIL